MPMKEAAEEVVLIIRKSCGRRIVSRTPLKDVDRYVLVYNNQYTNDPNTTQIASGSGVNSAAGNNAAIDSPGTYQQQSVGAGGTAHNKGLKGSKKKSNDHDSSNKNKKKEVVIVINDQVAKAPRRSTGTAATQVASGSGNHSTAGTNSAIDSAGTKQQHAVGGGSGSLAANTLVNRRKRGKRGKLRRRR